MKYIVLEFTDNHVLVMDDGRSLTVSTPSDEMGGFTITIDGAVDFTLRPARPMR